MRLLLSRQRTHQHHQHDAEILETLKRIEHQLVALIQEERQFYEESVQRIEANREEDRKRLETCMNVQAQWRQEDIAWRDAEHARVRQLAEEAKAHAERMNAFAERNYALQAQQIADALFPQRASSPSSSEEMPTTPQQMVAKRRPRRGATPDAPPRTSEPSEPNTVPVPPYDDAPPSTTEQASA